MTNVTNIQQEEGALLRKSEREIIRDILKLNDTLLRDHGRVLKSIRFHKPSISPGGSLMIEGYTVEWRHNVNGKIK